MPGDDEFAVIARWFAPLALQTAARGLLDDVAVIETRGALVITTDAIVESVHFLPDDPIDSVAQKALRVNLSDVAAKGAAPVYYFLTLQWPDSRPVLDIGLFAAGLARDQATFGVSLAGGDTTRTPGPLSVSVTLMAKPLGARTPSRADARVGDDVWVTGAIGDGVLGLLARQGRLEADAVDIAALTERYRRPQPRTVFAAAVAAHANASMDISDGLLADAAKIAAASHVRLVLDPDATPLSSPATRWLAAQPDEAVARARLLSGGDDYEILFTAAAGAAASLAAAADDIGLRLTRIGRVEPGAGLNAGGLSVAGHAHRLGT